jgi:tetratricopeptide (TPR) repeat protein
VLPLRSPLSPLPSPSLSLTVAYRTQAAVSLNAGHPEAHLFAALCAARRGDDASAAALLATAHTLAPHNAEIVRDYGAILLRIGRPREARPQLERAVGLLAQLHELGEQTAHSRGSLASAVVKLAACHLMLNEHQACLARVRDAASLEPSLRAAVAGLQGLCERGLREGIDTSKVQLDLAM